MKNEVQTDRNEILKVCAHFCTELYSSTLQDQHPSLKNTNPRLVESPTKHDIRSQEGPEKKKNKAPGIDNLASDIILLGGEESVNKYIYTNNKPQVS